MVILTIAGWSSQFDIRLGGSEHDGINVGLFVHAGAIDEKFEATSHGGMGESVEDCLVSVAYSA